MVILGRRQPKPPKQQEKKPPTSRIAKIASLKKFPDKDYANSILHDVAKVVAPIMHENNFKVGLLCEMYPKGGNLLGLNINGGSKIMLRLRYHSNSRLFLPMGDIIGTMLHELTHNVYGPHDQRFYNFLDKLKDRFEQIQYNPNSIEGYVCEENKLGGNTGFNGYSSIRDKRLKALGTGKFKAEKRKLGGINGISKVKSSNDPQLLRLLALEAAERRLKDGKWCNSREKEQAEPDNDELEIINVDEVTSSHIHESKLNESDKENKTVVDKGDNNKSVEIIDLTMDDPNNRDLDQLTGNGSGNEPEILVID